MVAAEVVAGEGVEEFRDNLTKHCPSELSVSRIALVPSLLIRCTNAAIVSELRALYHHHHLVVQEPSCAAGFLKLWRKSPWAGDRVNLACSHNQRLNQTTMLTRAGWDQTPRWPCFRGWGYIGWPLPGALGGHNPSGCPDADERIAHSPQSIANPPA